VGSDELQLLTFLAGGGAIAPEEASDMPQYFDLDCYLQIRTLPFTFAWSRPIR